MKLEINKRINNTPLPSIKIVDMRKEKKLISDSLINQIKINIKNNHQSMIFINKRGYTSFVICKKCGFIKSCPNCDISLVLHNFEKVITHYFVTIAHIMNSLKIIVLIVNQIIV